ncbi:MAG: carboxymuconolactone decarboxylase family protein [Calditrichaeota bacterium]|nr:carboxymuconolactone decarboxylase family protein [Calditrichota bacterium]
MSDAAGQFERERERLNEMVMKFGGLAMKRFWRLDEQIYQDGTLPGRVKELLGLTASLVLRCDDCVKYHLIQCQRAGYEDAEIEEALAVGLIVGGSIVIPHLRRAVEFWAGMKGLSQDDKA